MRIFTRTTRVLGITEREVDVLQKLLLEAKTKSRAETQITEKRLSENCEPIMEWGTGKRECA